jgi:hypothetical protein
MVTSNDIYVLILLQVYISKNKEADFRLFNFLTLSILFLYYIMYKCEISMRVTMSNIDILVNCYIMDVKEGDRYGI